MQRQYKFVYSANYAINLTLVIALLFIHWSGVEASSLRDWLQMAIVFWGLSMFLFLWSHSFTAGTDYKGPRLLDGRTTRLFTLSLLLIEGMTLYYSAFGHELFIRPATACLAIWIIGFIAAICRGKLIIPAKRVKT